MSEENITEEQLRQVLREFSTVLSERFGNILKHNNQTILEYCNQCIESITQLQAMESEMLGSLNASLTSLEKEVYDDIEKALTKAKRKSELIKLPTT